MDKQYYSDRMTERLPLAMQQGQKIKALFDSLDQEMNLMESGVKRLMRSRWYKFAVGWLDPAENLSNKRKTELGRIGALFGLLPGRDESSPEFRQRLSDYIQIHRDGLGTAKAILKLAALVYRAKIDFDLIYGKREISASMKASTPPASASRS